ncbi:MAG: peptide chain release factor 1 [Elusimicrobiota bacterium]
MKEKAHSVIEEFKALERKMAERASDATQMTQLSRERKRLEPIIQLSETWLKLNENYEQAQEIIKEGKDDSMVELALLEIKEIEPSLKEVEIKLVKLLNPPDPMAERNAIIEIRAGAGGDEAGLFAGDLLRMYTRFAQSKNLDVNVYSMSDSGVGGLKEVIFGVSGPYSYGWFRFEQGVHRVQRVPKTEAQGRIHTSTVTVAVLPEATEIDDVKIDPKDLKIDTYRSSGAGGQHVNKTESAIRITHIPSGLVVACQEERSQGQNKLRAMNVLRSKLQEFELEKQEKERRDLRRKQIGSGDRSEKIRTYNFPQDRITDHRINFSVFGVDRFIAGDLDSMIQELEKKEAELRKADISS